jgi:hypothetical protein
MVPARMSYRAIGPDGAFGPAAGLAPVAGLDPAESGSGAATMAAAADPITSERMRIIGVLRQKGQSRTNPELSERLLRKIVNAPDQFTDFTRPALHRRAWIG